MTSLPHAVPARIRKPTIDGFEQGLASGVRIMLSEMSSAYPDIRYLHELHKYQRRTMAHYIQALDELEPLFEGDPEIQVQIRVRRSELEWELFQS